MPPRLLVFRLQWGRRLTTFGRTFQPAFPGFNRSRMMAAKLPAGLPAGL
jgi:hypothetical protein